MDPGADDLVLLERAREQAARAYAPYSQFRVGAAVRTTSGEIFTGANVENASFSMTICAERSAIAAAVSAGHTRLEAVAIHVDGPHGEPCGACRQMLLEFGVEQVTCTIDGDVRTVALAELLPMPFHPSALPT